jgi:hypothetical protein
MRNCAKSWFRIGLFIEHIQQVFQGLSQTRSNWNFHGVLLLGIHPQKFDESRVYISLHFYMSIFHGSQMQPYFWITAHHQAIWKFASSWWRQRCEFHPRGGSVEGWIWIEASLTPSSRLIMWMMWDGLPGYKKHSPQIPQIWIHINCWLGDFKCIAWPKLMCKSNHLLGQAWYGRRRHTRCGLRTRFTMKVSVGRLLGFH